MSNQQIEAILMESFEDSINREIEAEKWERTHNQYKGLAECFEGV